MAKKPIKTKAKDGRSVKTTAHRKKISDGLKAYHADRKLAKRRYKNNHGIDSKGNILKTHRIDDKTGRIVRKNKAKVKTVKSGNNKPLKYHEVSRNIATKVLRSHYGPMRGFTEKQRKAMWRDLPLHKRKGNGSTKGTVPKGLGRIHDAKSRTAFIKMKYNA